MIVKSLPFLLLLLTSVIVFSQEIKTISKLSKEELYDTDLLTKEFYKTRRDELRKAMADSSVLVVFTSPVRNRSNDVDYEFHQNPDFYYLTGIREPDAVLLIFKTPQECDSFKTDELIFVEERNIHTEVWTGPINGVYNTEKDFGLKKALVNKQFVYTNIDWSKYKVVYSAKPITDAKDEEGNSGDIYSLSKVFNDDLANKKIKPNADSFDRIMAELRQNKQQEEIRLMRKACEISCKGFVELMKALEPGMHEYQTEALMEYFFKNNGAEFEGYPSICGAAENACVLHYSKNRRLLKAGDLMVVDAGAEYHGYTADITRTLPVNGTFNEQQKIIYNIVLEAQQAGIAESKSGNLFWAPNKAAVEVVTRKLKEIGLIKEDNEVRRYFMHGTSHYLGLDVHDVGTYQKLAPNQVITVEPGIYIPEGSSCDPKWWNIGVRIEDDILITVNGPVILSESAPKTIDEIEALMKLESSFNKLK